MNNSGTSLSKILNGINSTLNIANKAIPIYQQTKPMIKTVKQTYKTIKNSKTDISKMMKMMKIKNAIKKDMNNTSLTIPKSTMTPSTSNYKNTNNPTFFL